jgi:transposase
MINKDDLWDEMLTPQQRRAIPHLLSTPSIREACKKAGISHTTFYRWISNPIFKKELDRLSDEACRETVSILKRHTAQAAKCLVGLLKTKDPVLKRRVSNDILNHFLKYQENKELEERVLRLEQLAEKKKI